MITREHILDQIRRTAAQNGGKPLGMARFERETGINEHDWTKHWPRFGDAQREAGFEANKMTGAHSEDYVAEQLLLIARRLGKFPTFRELNVERQKNPELPTKKAFQRLGGKAGLARLAKAFCDSHAEYRDVSPYCEAVIANEESDSVGASRESIERGEVYLYKSSGHYKIGKTNDTVRRGNEIRLQLPEKPLLIHSIATDDPSGVELYWHRRFASKRVNGEWFKLDAGDVRAFKRWRRIF